MLADDEWRQGAAGYEVRVDGRWYPVRQEQMRDTKGGPNPTGHAIAWWTVDSDGAARVWCFAPGTEG